MILRRAENEFRIVSFSIAAAALKERIESYVIADEVNITDETAGWERVALWGDGTPAAVAATLGATPNAGSFVEANRGIGFGGRLAHGSFELLVPIGTGAALSQNFAANGARRVDGAAADRERILAGIPAIPADIGPHDLPNEGGLDDVAISYTKGCYLGQEVMARLKNLGQVRRRLHVVKGPGNPPASLAALFQNGKKAGELRSVVRDGDGFVAMAMLSLVNLDATQALGLSVDGPAEIQVVHRV